MESSITTWANEKAAAVHLGEFPKDAAQRYASAQPIPLSPGELFEKALDALLPHARDVRDAGAGNYGVQRQLEEIGMGRENRR